MPGERQDPGRVVLIRRQTVAKLEWGNRYTCFSCGCKYYDLNRSEPVCPRCGSDPREAVLAAKTTQRARRAASNPDEEDSDRGDLDDTSDVGVEVVDLLDEDGDEEEEDEDDEDY